MNILKCIFSAFSFLFFGIFFEESILLSQTTVPFTSTTTWTCPYGVTSVTVKCWGGGGSGGGHSTNTVYGGGGGAGGAFAQKVVTVVPGTTYTVTVGATKTGTAGAGAQGNPTWFSTVGTVYAEGGAGGAAPTGGAVSGGTGSSASSIGDFVYAGGNGAGGTGVGGIGGAGGGGAGSGGVGGNAVTTTAGSGGSGSGGSGGAGLNNTEGDGNAGSTYGGGGGGAFVADATNHNGGDGASGYLTLTYTGAAQTLTIGNSGDDFTSITAAANALEAAGVAAPIILEIQSDYAEGSETYPITMTAITGTSATNTVTYRPASGVTALVNGSNPGSATAVLTIDGADYLIFDGRPAGVGTTTADIQWTIRNERTAVTVGRTIGITNDATYNTFRFLNVEGESYNGVAQTDGVIKIYTGTTTGNDYNSFSYCIVQDLSTGGTTAFPNGGIVVAGTSAAISDDYITVDNCHVRNFGLPTVTSTIGIGGFNMSNWTITNNHLYHSSGDAQPTGVASYNYYMMLIDAGTGYTITGNYLGGTASNCGGTAYTMTGAASIRGIHTQATTAGTVTISNNIISNISITSTYNTGAGQAYFVPIRVFGSADFTISGNAIGSQTSNGVISLTHNHATALGGFIGIWDGSLGVSTITNNTLGGITINAGTSTATVGAMIHLYSGTATGTATIDGNIIGGTSGVGGAISIADDVFMRGIYTERTSSTTVTNNTIQNLSHTGDEEFTGIFCNVGGFTCTGNVLKDINFGAANTENHTLIAFGGNSAVNKTDPTIGTLAGSPTISSNEISNITVNNTSNIAQLIAIYINSSGTITCNSNTIGSTSANNISIASTLDHYGIYFAGNGTITCNSNTIQQVNTITTSTSTSFNSIYNSDGTLSSCTLNTIKNITSSGNKVQYMILHSNTDNASITSNTIQDITLSGTGASEFRGIYVNTSGTITVSSNTIGSTTDNNISLAGAATQYGILLDGNGTITCNSNTIQEFNLTETSASSGFKGIFNNDGTLSACNSNTITNITSAGALAAQYCIQHAGTADAASISSNSISNITLSSSSAAFYGISSNTTGATTISSNTIGSTTNNNISIAGNTANYGIRIVTNAPSSLTVNSNTIQEVNLTNTGTTVEFNGISTGFGALSATSNTIQNIDNAGTMGGSILRGIYCTSSSSGIAITSNTIKNLNAVTTSASSPVVRGISVTTGNGSIKKNHVSGLTNTATTSPAIYGIALTTTNWGLHNNVVLISNSSNTNAVTMYGINDGSTGTVTIYHNTVKVYGSASAGTLGSSAYYRSAAGIHTVKNNLFQNKRTGGSGDHTAYYASNTSGLTTDKNYLEVSADITKLGNYGGVNYNFADWKTNSGETNSLNGTETISSTTGEASTTFVGANAGADLFTGTTVVDDKDGDPRDAAPWIGAFEGGVVLPVTLNSFKISNYQESVKLNWKTSAEINNDHFEIERSDDGENFEFVNQVKGAGNSNYPISYFIIDNNYYSGINYYRLIMVDFNGATTISPTLSIDMSKKSGGIIIMTVNSTGQEVQQDYHGVVFDIYSDGSSVKRIQ